VCVFVCVLRVFCVKMCVRLWACLNACNMHTKGVCECVVACPLNAHHGSHFTSVNTFYLCSSQRPGSLQLDRRQREQVIICACGQWGFERRNQERQGCCKDAFAL